jgi:hypothetical protein
VVQDPVVRGHGILKKENCHVDREDSRSPEGILAINLEGDMWRKDNCLMSKDIKSCVV